MYKSTGEPCFLCGKTKDTAFVKGESFSLVLCREHAWEKVPDREKKEEGDAAQSERRGETA
jgi:hypothetical protein